jgi:hydroxyethylthiazole kinase-like uncharacterized protein yjeF
MKLYNAAQLREWDKATIDKYFEHSSELMEVAAQACVDFIIVEEIASIYEIVCGTGNNGGDGLCIARMLALEDVDVKVYIAGDAESGSEDFKKNLQLLLQTDVEIQFFSQEKFDFDPRPDAIIIDCLFGIGINRNVEGWLAELIERINSFENRILAIDIPSGLQPDLFEIQDKAIIKADVTLTFQVPKPAMLFEENHTCVGTIEVISIGLDHEFEAVEACEISFYQELEAIHDFKPRKKFAHKNTFGHAGVIAGSKGKIGAAMLCCFAAMRSGAGLVTAQIPACGDSILQTALPEVMTISDEGENELRSADILEINNATAIGPGIGQAPETAIMLRKILKSTHKNKLVIDADALNFIASKKLHTSIPEGSVLTPHVGEFDRLFGKHETSFDRFRTLRSKAVELKCTIILKGAHTMVASPDGHVTFNSTGNAGMATAGSGDVLTGVIVSLCSQGYTSETAARFGVYLHGVAGDMAADERGATGLMARDIIEFLPVASGEIETTREILGW